VRTVIVIAVGALVLVTGPPAVTAAPTPRIVNGAPADPAAFPFVAALLEADAYRKQGVYQAQFCGASLTTPSVLVTAAHCVVNQKTGERLDPSEILVSFGPTLKIPNPRIIAVTDIDVHPNYRLRTADNDIAVLTLAQPVEDVPLIPVVTLSQLDEYTAAGTKATIVGWGNTSSSGNVFPDALRSGQVEIFPSPSCGSGKSYVVDGVRFRGYRSDEASAENMICAAGVTADADVIDACQGDSGGPLLVGTGTERRLVGVVSWGERCASYFPGVYTRVSSELEFLRVTGAIPTVAPSSPPRVTVVGLDGRVHVTTTAPSDGSAVTGFAVSVVDPATGQVRTCTSAPTKRTGTCTVEGLVNGTRYLVNAIYGSPLGNSPVSADIEVIPSTQPIAGVIRDWKRDGDRVRFRLTPSDPNGTPLVSDRVICTSEKGRVTRGSITERQSRLPLAPGTYSCVVRIETAAGAAESMATPVRISRS
jgi:secreted trypsin-like serine protease